MTNDALHLRSIAAVLAVVATCATLAAQAAAHDGDRAASQVASHRPGAEGDRAKGAARDVAARLGGNGRWSGCRRPRRLGALLGARARGERGALEPRQAALLARWWRTAGCVLPASASAEAQELEPGSDALPVSESGPVPVPVPEPELTPPPAPAEQPVSAVAFDGVDDVVIAAAADPTASQTSTARTIEAWIRVPEGATHRAVLGIWQHAIGGFYFRLDANGRLAGALEDGITRHETTGVTRLDDGAWHHVAMVWRPGVSVDLYLDGVREPTTVAQSGMAAPYAYGANSAAILIGASGEHPSCTPTGWCDLFTGEIDELRYSLGERYAGDSFTPPLSMEADADTIGLWTLDGPSAAAEGLVTGTPSSVGDPTPTGGTR